MKVTQSGKLVSCEYYLDQKLALLDQAESVCLKLATHQTGTHSVYGRDGIGLDRNQSTAHHNALSNEN